MDYNDATFRATFPEFADTTKYPAATIQIFWDVAGNFIDTNDNQWRILNDKSLVYATNCMTAHLMILSQMQSTSAGGPGSEQGGFNTSATIGEVSVATLAPPAKDGFQWWLAQTPYGQQLWALLKMLSVGGISVGGIAERNSFRKAGGIFL